jgi:hypothetical protein
MIISVQIKSLISAKPSLETDSISVVAPCTVCILGPNYDKFELYNLNVSILGLEAVERQFFKEKGI